VRRINYKREGDLGRPLRIPVDRLTKERKSRDIGLSHTLLNSMHMTNARSLPNGNVVARVTRVSETVVYNAFLMLKETLKFLRDA